MFKSLLIGWPMLVVALFTSSIPVQAAPREANKNDAALLKLQASVKALTAERDAAKAELELKESEIGQLKKEKLLALSGKDDLNNALSAQKNVANEVRERLAQANSKLQEAQDKHKDLNQAKAELAKELTALKAQQQASEQQLAVCAQHNVKLYQSGAELLSQYQNKGTLTTLLADEPLLQFQSVEMETIVQDYQDKLNAHKLVE